jgi:hypothetical protein
MLLLSSLRHLNSHQRQTGIDGANWIHLTQDRVQWRAFVNTVMNLRFPQRKQDFFDKLNDNQLFKLYSAQWPGREVDHSPTSHAEVKE